MFQFHAILGDEFMRNRDPKLARALNSGLVDFDAWLTANLALVPIA